MSHPGDSDNWDSAESEDDNNNMSMSRTSNRIATPICPYGTKCYRKNAAHRANYRHDVDPDLSRDSNSFGDASDAKGGKSRRKIRRDQEVDDAVDESYDYSDSFINDRRLFLLATVELSLGLVLQKIFFLVT